MQIKKFAGRSHTLMVRKAQHKKENIRTAFTGLLSFHRFTHPTLNLDTRPSQLIFIKVCLKADKNLIIITRTTIDKYSWAHLNRVARHFSHQRIAHHSLCKTFFVFCQCDFTLSPGYCLPSSSSSSSSKTSSSSSLSSLIFNGTSSMRAKILFGALSIQ